MRITFGGGSSGNRSLYIMVGLSVVLLIVLWQVLNKLPALFSFTHAVGGGQTVSAGQFSDDQKEALKKHYAGFWVYESDTIGATNMIHKKDLLELKDNGILWQVITWNVAMPGGTPRTFTHVRTAYCNPFGRADDGDTICEVAILKQAFLNVGDTCVDKNTKVVQLETWNASRNGDTLLLCNRKYRRYNDDIFSFFPPGLIRFVDSIGRRMCNGQVYVSEFVRSALAADFVKTVSAGDRKSEIVAMIERYYGPAVIAENWRGFVGAVPTSIGISFQVLPDGSVSSVTLTSGGRLDRMFFRGLQFEMEAWRFPKQVGPGAQKTMVGCTFDLESGTIVNKKE